MVLMYCAPESPWWLVRKGRLAEAKHSIERLGRRSLLNDGAEDTVAMMKRVIDMEKSESSPSYIELFKGTDLRRTLIVCGIYAAQNLAGNLIANQAVYFFERELTPLRPQGNNLMRVIRGWYFNYTRLCFGSYHFCSSNDRRHPVLGSYNLLWPKIDLPVGNSIQRRLSVCVGNRSISWYQSRVTTCSSFVRFDRFRSIHILSCTCLVGCHW
jgi:hypothetical protein